ncbi:MAG: mechanosensitive ion channel family protein [Pseudomonadales bacterium]
MNELLKNLQQQISTATETAAQWAMSPQFYAQLGAIATAVIVAYLLSALLKAKVPALRDEPAAGRLFYLRSLFYRLRVLTTPLLIVFFLGVAVEVAVDAVGQSWLIRVAQGLAVIALLYRIITHFIQSPVIKVLAKWIGIPLATLEVFGWLDNVTAYLADISMSVGNIHISLLALSRTLLFGSVLFWLGRVSNNAGKQVIRNQTNLDVGTREVFAKLFELALFVVIFLLLLQVMGISLTALAVFGGALGVGLGFGLQQIASNFISGFIILLDRSLTIGDYIELEDGRAGVLRELNMRFGVIETYDGKDIMVPNEQFITSSYTNWTHKNPQQRYALNLQVAYATDLDALFENIRAICTKHPQVISGDDAPVELRPDAEIAGFGESGIDILVEFWMEGIDDGRNRVGADLLYDIWKSIKENGMEIPYPQREIRILSEQPIPNTDR